MRVADYIAKFLKSKKVDSIFMLTGYGAMYMNDAIKVNNISHIAPRNEAAAPVMGIGYSRVKNQIGVVCVTAGPGATNALPGLAEAYVESVPLLILSGQVNRKFTSSSNNYNLRTYGTAEINIIDFVKNHTKYSSFVDDPKIIKYELEKAYHFCVEGRPGPVWLDIPLDVQNEIIDERKIEGYIPTINKNEKIKIKKIDNYIKKIISNVNESNNPILVIGHGAKISKTEGKILDFCRKSNIPFCLTRFTNDICSHNERLCLGVLGEKGQRYTKILFEETDYVLSMGSRLAPTFTCENYNFFFPNAKIDMIDIEKEELNKFIGYKNFDNKINHDLKDIVFKLVNNKKVIKKDKNNTWLRKLEKFKKDYTMITPSMMGSPIDLYNFMNTLDSIADKNSILITDAGSNYYIGGQTFNFDNNAKEISSTSNAAMGITLPLAIGAAVADTKKTILAVTGDGSIELNIQELKTMSHYNLNVNLFVINNGGYASMRNWQDNFGDDNRLDTDELTGVGTLNFKNIANAFDLNYEVIKNSSTMSKKIKNIISKKGPKLIEVFTKIDQLIITPYELGDEY